MNKLLLILLIGMFLLASGLSLVEAKSFTIFNSSNSAVPYFSVNGTTGYVGLGTENPLSVLQIPNNEWLSARNYADSGIVNMFKVNDDNQIEVGGTLNIGNFEFSEDSGLVTFVDMPVSSSPSAGTVESYVFKIDGENLLGVYSEADGLGGIQNKRIGIGTVSPSYPLDVVGSVNAYDFLINGTGIEESISGQLNSSSWNRSGTDVYLANVEDSVGIGTSSPRSTLDIAGANAILTLGSNSGTAWFHLYNNSGTKKWGFSPDWDSGKLSLYDYTRGAAVMQWEENGDTIINNGNVGIGTDSPAQKLDVVGAARISSNIIMGNATSQGNLYLDGGYGTYITAANNRQPIQFYVNDSERVRIDGLGNVGIGTTNPGQLLHLSQSAATPTSLHIQATSDSTNADATTIFDSNQATFSVGVHATGTDSFKISENADIATDPRFTIIQGGNVGIGTDSPDSLLHLSTVGPARNTRYDGLIIQQTPTGGSPYSGFGANLVWKGATYKNSTVTDLGGISVVATDHSGSTTGHEMIFELVSNSTTHEYSERMRIDEGGNLGIGTSSPVSMLHINNDSSDKGGEIVLSLTSTNNPPLSTDDLGSLWFGSLEGSGYRAAGIKGIAELDFNSDDTPSALTFLTTPDASGTAVERMRIDRDGNVGIGTTDPQNELNVIGDLNVTGIIYNADGDAVVGGSGVANRAAFWTDSDTLSYDGNFTWDNTNKRLGIGTTSPTARLDIKGGSGSDDVLVFRNIDDYELGSLGYANNDAFMELKDGTLATKIKLNSDGDSYLNGGDVGIGTNSPANKLTVSGPNTSPSLTGTSVANASLLISNSDTAYGTFFGTTGSGIGLIQQRRQSSETYYDLALNPYGGDVGIGTASPSNTLHVDKDASIGGFGSLTLANAGLRIEDSAISAYFDGNTWVSNGNGNLNIGTVGGQDINFGTNDTTRATIDSSGRVGIGTTSPTYFLDIQDTTVDLRLRSTGNNDARILLGTNDDEDWHIISDASESGKLRFINQDGASLPVLTLQQDGNVGIGTATPQNKLNVAGDANVTGTMYIGDTSITTESNGDVNVW